VRLGVAVRRVEADGQRVPAGTQQRRDGEPVTAVHVLGAADLGAVQGDRGDGVQPGADQVHPVGVAGLPGERGLVDPVGAPDPGEPALVVIQVRVRDQAGGEQIGVHAAGHGRRHRPVDDLPRHLRTGYGPQHPTLVQRLTAHDFTLPSMIPRRQPATSF
jgi:hypothetical protein